MNWWDPDPDWPDPDEKPKDWVCESGHTLRVVPLRERCPICGKTEREKA